MSLNDISDGEVVFVDSNIFIYYTQGSSEECFRFFKRCYAGDIHGVTSHQVLAEAAHILMVAEAIEKKLVKPPRSGLKLIKRPLLIRQLHKYYDQLERIYKMGIEIINYPVDLLVTTQHIRQLYGLAVADSLIYGFMKSEGVTNLASADAVFTTISDVRVFAPEDIK